MRVTATITIEDDTSAEKLRAYGISERLTCELYRQAFQDMLDVLTEEEPGLTRKHLHVTITDNTKEVMTP
jgi:hypothetical protein